jgi:hypothetical protein
MKRDTIAEKKNQKTKKKTANSKIRTPLTHSQKRHEVLGILISPYPNPRAKLKQKNPVLETTRMS